MASKQRKLSSDSLPSSCAGAIAAMRAGADDLGITHMSCASAQRSKSTAGVISSAVLSSMTCRVCQQMATAKAGVSNDCDVMLLAERSHICLHVQHT